VAAACTLRVPVRPDPPKKPEEEAPNRDGDDDDDDGADDDKQEPEMDAKPWKKPDVRPKSVGDVVWVEREFRARGHLIVTVPIYVDWNRLGWESR